MSSCESCGMQQTRAPTPASAGLNVCPDPRTCQYEVFVLRTETLYLPGPAQTCSFAFLLISSLCIDTTGALERQANKFAFAGSLRCAVPSPNVSMSCRAVSKPLSQKNAQRYKKAGFAAGALCPARGQRRGSLLSLHACVYLCVFCIVASLTRVHLC